MVERGTEGLLAVQRQVAAVQASGEEGVQQCSAEMRGRLEDLHRNHHRHQDLIQVLPSPTKPPSRPPPPPLPASLLAPVAFTLLAEWRAVVAPCRAQGQGPLAPHMSAPCCFHLHMSCL